MYLYGFCNALLESVVRSCKVGSSHIHITLVETQPVMCAFGCCVCLF